MTVVKMTVVKRILNVCVVTIAWIASTVAAQELEYNRDIRPILSDRCFFCHGPDDEERQADLRLDLEAAAKEFAIVPGNPEESEFVARITTTDSDLQMPPPDSGKSLSSEEIEKLVRWVRQGAVYQPFWAYVPPQRPEDVQALPLHQAIDQLLAQELERRGLQMSAPADPVTLLRRVYFDLIGLPPAPDAVDRFQNDSSSEAYEKLIDDLLDSDHFGERLAIYWLDLVRYADTVGYHGDQDHNISPYRDWVIQAFNDNMPFDQFTREQLAGDLLPDATLDQRIATGYNRMLQTSHEGGVQPKEYLAIYAADRVRNVSAVWMGATLGCAQCHHHKYDPYTIEDFYAFSAFFADIDEAQHFKVGSNALPTRRPPEIEVLSKSQRARLAEIDRDLAELKDADAATRQQLLDEKQAIESSARLTMVTVSIEPREIRVLPRGNWLDESGPIVEPAVPGFLGELDTSPDRATRLDLANWLVDAQTGVGGLTARVQANRIWYLLFGSGISRSLDDFGGQGQPPTHPELLDTLAVEFLESGWDLKHLIKQIMLSNAYRQSSTASPQLLELDPYNELFARQGRFRLPAEIIRDNALFVSGLIHLEYGGPSARPYQPEGYYRHLNFPKRDYTADQDASQYRRGVYVHWQRQFLHPMLKAFDAPSREECTAQRSRSNTPLAALVSLNDPTFVEAARILAERLIRDGGTTVDEKIDFALKAVLSRRPDDVERQTLQQVFHLNLQHYQDHPAAVQKLLAVGLAPFDPELDQVEIAAWTAVARAVLNLNETMTRN